MRPRAQIDPLARVMTPPIRFITRFAQPLVKMFVETRGPCYSFGGDRWNAQGTTSLLTINRAGCIRSLYRDPGPIPL